MKQAWVFALVVLVCSSCSSNKTERTGQAHTNELIVSRKADTLRTQILDYLSGKRARVGVAILGPESDDTITVNGNAYYSLMSVAKFPQALLLLHLADEGKFDLSAPIHFEAKDLGVPTGSSFRKDHPGKAVDVSVPELLRYSMGQSDNITAVKMFELEGGPAAVNNYVQSLGIKDVKIVTDYTQLGDDSMHDNRATPVAMVQLLRLFYDRKLLKDSTHQMLWKAMVESTSGANRIKGLLPAGTQVAHKTGTSGTDEESGITKATNDLGIVQLPGGGQFAIGVFVTDSKEIPDSNAAIIARISRLVYDHFAAGK